MVRSLKARKDGGRSNGKEDPEGTSVFLRDTSISDIGAVRMRSRTVLGDNFGSINWVRQGDMLTVVRKGWSV